MKKLISTLGILFLLAVSPKMANAESGCHTEIICGHYCLCCDFYDHVIWSEIYCGGSELDL